MSLVSAIKIVLENGEHLDYETEEGLGIKLNRITEDYQQPDKRFGEFSYTFSLPKTNNNNKVWEYPDVKGRTRIFTGKNFNCKLYSNSELLIEGIIELSSFDSDSYKCLFFSKYTQLLDDLKGKKLVDMKALPKVVWEFEKTIVNHINANYTSDQKDYQFPFCFYKTPFISGYTGTTKAEAAIGYTYNYVESYLPFKGKNPVYFPQFPPAIYLNSILKGILLDAGWSLGGTFFETDDIKKIVILYTGDAENYSGSITTGSTKYLDLNRLLPTISQIDFLKSIINAFNLYFTIDNTNKQISFETYNTLFADNSNAYDITLKVDASSIVISKPDAESRIIFDTDKDNTLVAGYGRTFDYVSVFTGQNPTYLVNPNYELRLTADQYEISATYSKSAFANLWNKSSGEKEIKLSFSPVNYFPYAVINEKSTNNTSNTSSFNDIWTVGIPLISEQTPSDHKNNLFAEDAETDYCSGNDSTNMKYEGGLKMAFYYGQANYDLTVGSKKYRDFTYISIATGGTCSNPSFARVKIPIASPFKLLTNSEKTNLIDKVSTYSPAFNQQDFRFSELGAEAHNLLLTYYSLGTSTNSQVPTKFSLTLGENADFTFPNLYSYFHEKKYVTLRNGHLLKVAMLVDENDWKAMQIYRPILYNSEYYQLVSIKNYDPVKRSAEVTLLKKS